MDSDAPPNADRRRFLAQLAVGAATAVGWIGAGWALSGGTENRITPCLRPPAALPEKKFLAVCIRCGRCADACPNRAIVPFTEESGKELAMMPGPGQRSTPVIFPRRQACMLCQGAYGEDLLCTTACPTGALKRTAKTAEAIRKNVRMGAAEVDLHLCYSYNGASCGACVRACPLEGHALKAGLWEKPIVDSAWCVGCGLCERACIKYPQAIRVKPRPVA